MQEARTGLLRDGRMRNLLLWDQLLNRNAIGPISLVDNDQGAVF